LGLLFSIPPGVELQTKKEGFTVGEHDELRLQGKGAQTALPPSRYYLGGYYHWLPGRGPGEVKAASMPGWAVELMQVKSQEPRASRCTVCAPSDEIALALSALARLKSERADDLDVWLRVGLALHAVSDDDVMLEAWVAWSRHSGKFTEGECAAMWEKFDRAWPGRRVTLGTLVYMAREDGWRPPTPRVTRTRPGHFLIDFTSAGVR
jgi:hypothetical protein